jgi:hypothetical protein
VAWLASITGTSMHALRDYDLSASSTPLASGIGRGLSRNASPIKGSISQRSR